MDLVGPDAREVVSDAGVVEDVAVWVGEVEVGEFRVVAEHFDEHHACDVFAEGVVDEQFLREFDVVAYVGHVDAGSADVQAVVDLDGFEFDDARACEVAEQDVLGHLGVWTGRGSDGVAGALAVELNGEIRCVVSGGVPRSPGEMEEGVLDFGFAVESGDEVCEGCGVEFSHDSIHT